MAVFPAEVVARVEFGPAFVIFPNLMIARFPGRATEGALLQDVAFRITVQLQETRFLTARPPIRQNDQDLSLHFAAHHAQGAEFPPDFSRYSLQRSRVVMDGLQHG